MAFDLLDFLASCDGHQGIAVACQYILDDLEIRRYFDVRFGSACTRYRLKGVQTFATELMLPEGDLLLTLSKRLRFLSREPALRSLGRLVKSHNLHRRDTMAHLSFTDDGVAVLEVFAFLFKADSRPLGVLRNEFAESVCVICNTMNELCARAEMMHRGYALLGRTTDN